MVNETTATLPNVRILNLKPDDILVVSYKEKLTYEKRQDVQQALRALFPDHDVLIMDNGTDLGITRVKSSS